MVKQQEAGVAFELNCPYCGMKHKRTLRRYTRVGIKVVHIKCACGNKIAQEIAVTWNEFALSNATAI